MRTLRFLTVALIISLVLVAPQIRVSATKVLGSTNYAAGEVVVKLKAGAPELQVADRTERLMRISRLVSEEGSAVSDRAAEPLATSTSNERVNKIIADRGLDRVFVLKVNPEADIHSIVSDLRARDDVEYAEPNYLITFGTVVPNDPQFALQWALLNPGLYINDAPSTQNADIKASPAWDITKGSPDVIIAVTDTGIDLTHPDLERNIYTNTRETPGNGIDDDHNGYIDDVHGFNVADQNGDTSDAVGHGTFMAGIIAAEMNNNIGITGVCQSKIVPARFYKRYGPDPFQFSATVIDGARAFLYSIAAGASIINASWSTKLISDDLPADASRVLEDAVIATNDAGVLLVCLAGNEGFNLDYSKIYPASYGLPNQIVVAASDFNDEIWHPLFYPWLITTGFGPHSVHLTAPGVSVLTTQARGDCLLCTQSREPEEWYAREDGTSISAAYVSGVAALLKSKYPNDSGILLKRRILEGVEVKDSLRSFEGELTVITGGRLNALGALNVQVNITPPTLTEFTYKAKNEKFIVYGSGMQQGVRVIVGKSSYTTKPRSDDGTAFLARVPKTAIPAGIPVEVKVRNPDGGESQVIILTR
jgi:subtilisin family serine protease